jgi:formate dehydrogenase subunit gamma
LHNIQAKLRCVPESAVKPIAKALNLSRAEVHGVITYYHTFTSTPLGEHVIEVCRAESCQAVGGRSIEQKFKDHLGVNFGETTTDGKITLEAVYCLGNCGCSPAIRIGKKMYGRVSENKVEQIINDIQEC